MSSKVILDQYQRGCLVGMDNRDIKIIQIFYTCNSLEIKLDIFSKSIQGLVIIGYIARLEDAPIGEGFPLQAKPQEIKLGGSECIVVLISQKSCRLCS